MMQKSIYKTTLANLYPILSKRILCILCLFALPLTANAQVHAQLRLEMGIPHDEFKNNLPRKGFGLGGGLLVPVAEKIPLHLGLEGGYQIYSSENESFPNYDIETNFNLVHGHLVARILPPFKGKVRPYLDAMFGFKYLYTRSTTYEPNTSNELDTFTEFDDIAWSYGGSGGVHFILTKGIALDTRLVFVSGSRASYLDKGSIRVDPIQDKVYYDSKTSRTDMFMPQLGIVFYLEDLE